MAVFVQVQRIPPIGAGNVAAECCQPTITRGLSHIHWSSFLGQLKWKTPSALLWTTLISSCRSEQTNRRSYPSTYCVCQSPERTAFAFETRGRWSGSSPQGQRVAQAGFSKGACSGMSQQISMAEPDLKAEIEEVATVVAKEAGQLIVAASGNAQNVETKSVRSDLVTEVDKACEDLIKQRIQDRFPHHAILGEESSTSAELERIDATLADSDWTWIVDPIDGTLNFVGGMPLSVVSIGVAKGNRIEVGVVFNPYSGELFTARRGEGAFLNGERISTLPPETELEDGAVSVGFPSKRPVRERMLRGVSAVAPHARTIRALGTAALHMSYVAAGKLACFFELNLKPWDVAAAWLIVEEAGGQVTDMAGGPMRLRAGPILASCGGQVHQRVLSLLREAECTGKEADLK